MGGGDKAYLGRRPYFFQDRPATTPPHDMVPVCEPVAGLSARPMRRIERVNVEPIESFRNGPHAGGEPVHYSGVVVIVPPDRVETCARDLGTLAGVELHYRHPESGRIVAVLEGRTAEENLEILRRIQAIPDVLVAAPVYHYVDATPDVAEGEAGSSVERK